MLKKISLLIILILPLYIITSILTPSITGAPAFARELCTCHMPPLNENAAGKYASFILRSHEKKAAASSLRSPDRAYTESRPYEQLRPAVGTHDILAILVDFDDRPFGGLEKKYRSPEYYSDLLFNENLRSVNCYYREVSRGKLNFKGAVARHSMDSADASGYWFRSSKSYKEWGADQQASESIDSANISSLAQEAIQSAAGFTDLSKFDADHDGVVSPYELHIVIIHSGHGQERTGDSNDIWSHRFNLVTPVRTNNVLINDYVLIASDSPIGVLCHELGHDLGLFDSYDTNTGRSVLGSWSLMDRGAWNGVFPRQPGETPSYPSAYERIMLGWIKPQYIGANNIEIPVVSASVKEPGTVAAEAVRAEVPGSSGREYLLFENRYKTRGSFDEDLPPLLGRANGILVYHVNENMPDRTFYGYANDSRNSAFRVELVHPIYSDIEAGYFTKEFSRFSSNLKNFCNGALNEYRINMAAENSETQQVIFNMPYAYLSNYEVVIGASNYYSSVPVASDEILIKATFGHFNPGFTSLSVILSKEGVLAKNSVKIQDDTTLLAPQNIASGNFEMKIKAKDLPIIDADSYFARFILTDGGYSKEYSTGKFQVKGLKDRVLKVVPESVNNGAVQVNVILSEFVNYIEDTESVFISYNTADGSRVEKQIIEYTTRPYTYSYLQKISRQYTFRAGEDVASDIKIRVAPSDTRSVELTAEVKLARSLPVVTHGVYSSVLLPGILMFVAESDRKLVQAQLFVNEDGAATTSVAMISRTSADSNVYYYNYRISNYDKGAIKYEISAVDAAGNSIIADGSSGGELYKFSMDAKNSTLEFKSGSIAICSENPVTAGQPAYMAVSDEGGYFKIDIMPNDLQPVSADAVLKIKPDFKGVSEGGALISSDGYPVKKDSVGSFSIERFGSYRLEKAAAAIKPALFYAVPCPARNKVRFMPDRGAAYAGGPLSVKIFDASMHEIFSNDSYSGGDIDVSRFANGAYFYRILTEDEEKREFSGKFSVLR